MKTTIRTILCATTLILLSAWPVHAQRVLTTTTLSANVAATDDTMTVTSTTGFTVGQLVYIDYEVMRIQELIGGAAGTATVVRIARGVDGTQVRAHDNTDRLFATQQVNDFKQQDPDFTQDCTRGTGQATILPWINTRTGYIWNCRSSTSAWVATNVMPVTWDSVQVGTP